MVAVGQFLQGGARGVQSCFEGRLVLSRDDPNHLVPADLETGPRGWAFVQDEAGNTPAGAQLGKQIVARRFGLRFLVGKWKVITTRAPGPARASAVGRVGEMAVKDHSLRRESIE